MRIFLMILLVLIVLLGLVCISGVVIRVSFWNGTFDLQVRYCGIRIFPRPKKKGRKKQGIRKKYFGKKKSKDKSETKEKPENEDKPENENKSEQEGTSPEKKERRDFLMDKLRKQMQKFAGRADMAENFLRALPAPLKVLLRGISWYAIETDFVIGGTDAAECAMLYGKVHSLLHPLLGQAGTIINVKQKRIAIECDFTADTCKWNFACRFRIRIGAVILCGIGLLWNYLAERNKARKQLSGKKR